MEEPIVLLAEAGVPKEREVGRVAGCEEVDVGGGC